MWFNANEKINIILTLVYKYILFKYLMHGSNQKQNKQNATDYIDQSTNQKKKNEISRCEPMDGKESKA